MECIIIAIGTEVVSGDITNTNAGYLANYLKSFGIKAIEHIAVLDIEKNIVRAIKRSLKKADLVITTGGLGPTYDDITKTAVSQALKRPLVKSEESLEQIKAYFLKLGREMTTNNENQAFFPENSIIVENKNGTAPACITTTDKGSVIMLPGPPEEMISIMESKRIVDFLKKNKTEEIYETVLKFFGIGESSLEEKLKDYMKCCDDLILAPYAKTGEVELKITAKGTGPSEAKAKAVELKEKIYAEAGEFIYTEGKLKLEEVLIGKLKANNKKIVTAESCTGGLTAQKITAISGASEVFSGGFITYCNEMKVDFLDVKQETLDNFGAVSKGVAIEMAEGALKRTNADVAVSITGIAGPDGGSEEKPVGLVYIGIATKEMSDAKRFNFVGSRDKIRETAAKNALHMALLSV